MKRFTLILAAFMALAIPSSAHAVPGKVILLPGGGWQNAHPAMMNPQLSDFRAHGVNAEAITYPLRNIDAAINHVRARVQRESGPVVVYGVSAGGTIAAALAAEGSVAGAVNGFGPTDLTRWIGAGELYMQAIGLRTNAQRRAVSPFWRLRPNASPLLQQCGLVDPLVTIDQCIRHHEASRRIQPLTRLDRMVGAHAQGAKDIAAAREWTIARLKAAAPAAVIKSVFRRCRTQSARQCRALAQAMKKKAAAKRKRR